MLTNNFRKSNLYLIIISYLPALIAIILWLTNKSFIGLSFFQIFGQATGIIGIVLLSINFVYTTRFKFIEKYFGGLDRLYIEHHNLGTVAFLLLLSHPLFLAFNSPDLIFPINNPPVMIGYFALIIMALLLIITFYARLAYHVWKFSHQWLGLALIFSGLHLILIPSDVSYNIPFRLYLIFIVILGICSYIYRTLGSRFFVKRHMFKISKIIPGEVTRLDLIPVNNPLKFSPGQFTFVQFPKISNESHPFSIVSDQKNNSLSFAIKNFGDFTNKLNTLKVGDLAKIEGPYGGFNYLSKKPRQIWIAGGIGMAPFMSSLNSLNQHSEYDVILYYIVSDKNKAVFASDLPKNRQNLKIYLHESNRSGKITADQVIKNAPDYKQRDILLCGPKSLMVDLKDQFKRLGVPDSQIDYEDFSLI